LQFQFDRPDKPIDQVVTPSDDAEIAVTTAMLAKRDVDVSGFWNRPTVGGRFGRYLAGSIRQD
jgi:hypothetical protein